MYNYYFRWSVTILFCAAAILLLFSPKSEALSMFFVFLLAAFMRMLLSLYSLMKYNLTEKCFEQKACSETEIEAELKCKRGLCVIFCCMLMELCLALTINWMSIFRNFADWVQMFFS